MTSPGREALAEAARLEAARVYGSTYPDCPQNPQEARRRRNDGPRAVDVSVDIEIPAERPTLDVCAENDQPERISDPARRTIEQARARGWDERQAADATSLSVASVRRVWAAMDRAAG